MESNKDIRLYEEYLEFRIDTIVTDIKKYMKECSFPLFKIWIGRLEDEVNNAFDEYGNRGSSTSIE